MVQEEPGAHLGAVVGGTDLMNEPTEQQRQMAESNAGENLGGVRAFVKTEPRGVDEADRQAVQNAAKVFIRVGDVTDVALPVGQRPVATAVVADRL